MWKCSILNIQLLNSIGGRADISLNLPLEDPEWHCPGIQHGVVEAIQGKLFSERFLCFFSKLDNLQLTDHVGTGLAGVDHIALDLAGFNSVIDSLLTRPPFCMDTGVNHQAPRSEQFRVELSQPSFQISVVPSCLRREFLRVKAPSFPQRGNTAKSAGLPKSWDGFILHLQCDLEMMSWDGLVINQAS